MAALSRCVPTEKPVPAASAAVNLAAPGELTLSGSPFSSKAKLFGAEIELSIVLTVHVELPSSATKPSLYDAPGDSSVKNRNPSARQFASAGTSRSNRSVVTSYALPRIAVCDELRLSGPLVAGSALRASPDDRIAKVGPLRGKSVSGASATPVEEPAAGSVLG